MTKAQDPSRGRPSVGPRDPLPGVVYPPQDRLAGYVARGVLGTAPLGDAFFGAARRYAHRCALVDARTGGAWTYSELIDAADRFAAALLALGLGPRDRMLFQVGNVPELFIGLYGCFRIGVIPIATLPIHGEAEIGYIADLTGAKAHMVQADYRGGHLPALAEKVASTSKTLEHLITIGQGHRPAGSRAFAELLDLHDAGAARSRIAAVEAVDPFDVAIFQLSGGTTGTPKLIPRLHNEYLFNMEAWADASAYGEDTVVFWPMPIMHNAGLVCGAPPAHLRGGRVVLNESLAPADLLATISRFGVTTTVAPIPIIIRLLDSGLVPSADLSTVRDFITAGQTASVERDLHVPGAHLFGMSEGLCMRTKADHPQDARLNTVGGPLSPDDEIRLLYPGTTVEVSLGEVGELCCRGPYTISGYYKAEEHNARAFTEDGFYRSGDLMRAHLVDGRTYYSFEGRIKDNIDRGGEKISAEEVERHVLVHPDVREVAVVGMPDREFGERVCAFIIPEPGRSPPDVAALREFLLANGVAKYKCPEHVEITDNFPVTKVGKVSKPDLRKSIAEKYPT